MKKLTGISVSQGIIVGKAFLYLEGDLPELPRRTITQDEVASEWERFLKAQKKIEEEARRYYQKAIEETSKQEADIIAAHILMLRDPEFTGQIKKDLETQLENIERIVRAACRKLAQTLINAEDPYLRERAADINDISRRLIRALMSVEQVSLKNIQEDVILVAHDLLPSEIMTMNRRFVKGIAMDLGSKTSHTAILAQAFDIPAVLGLSAATREIQAGDTVVLKGSEVIVNPDKAYLDSLGLAIGAYREKLYQRLSMRELPAETKDGRQAAVKANIEIPEEAEQARNNGAQGIGLYRTEFLFLTPGQAYDEEAQTRAYTQVVETMGELPVTIRTIDAGGDKLLPDIQSADFKNPLLGWRAIRFSLAQPEFFKTQLRAILRASAKGKVRIMFPMISGVEELGQAQGLFEEAKEECRQRNQPFAEDIPLGAMIEIPSAAMTADILAEKSDFFSIGTNDLVQYTLAVDRGNERVSYLAQPFHPAMLRFFKRIIDAAHEAGIPVGMCGELARSYRAVPLLLGLGLDEFSMSPSAIPAVKEIIRSVSQEDCEKLAREVMRSKSHGEILAMVSEWMEERQIGENDG